VTVFDPATVAAKEAADWVRATRRPAFLHLRTVRLLGHAGSDVEQSYRSLDEIEAAEEKYREALRMKKDDGSALYNLGVLLRVTGRRDEALASFEKVAAMSGHPDAERASDAPVGQRLVETGVIDPIELARGTVSVGAVEHLGRLFDRNPSVDRDVVLVAVSIMTSDLIVDIANRLIPSVSATAYRHHRCGIQGWFVGSFDPSQLMRSIGQLGSAVVGSLPVSSDLAPVSALMAVPAPPVEPVPPAFTRLADLPVADFDADELTIDWNEPFDDPPPSAVFGGVPFTNGADPGRLGSRG